MSSTGRCNCRWARTRCGVRMARNPVLLGMFGFAKTDTNTGFRVTTKRARRSSERKARSRRDAQRIKRRLARAAKMSDGTSGRPMLGDSPVCTEVSERVEGHGYGGLIPMVTMVQKLGLTDLIDERVPIFERRRQYHESDHVLNFALNALAGGNCLEDMERLRQNEALLTNLRAASLPDPTTAGDFFAGVSSRSRLKRSRTSSTTSA